MFLKQFFTLVILYFFVLGNGECTENIIDRVPVQFKGRFRPKIAERIISQNNAKDEAITSPHLNQEYLNYYDKLKKDRKTDKEISNILNQILPIQTRLEKAGSKFKALPLASSPGSWVALDALGLVVFNKHLGKIEPINNFTLYPDQRFKEIQNIYLSYQRGSISKDQFERILSEHLLKNYQTIANTKYATINQKELTYPSMIQLKAEYFYYQYSLVSLTAIGYFLSFIAYCFVIYKNSFFIKKLGQLAFYFSFFLHTIILCLRAVILARPPVTTMHESLLFVPWIAACASLIFGQYYKTYFPQLIASFLASILLIITRYLNLYLEMENVQAVLDSKFWLTIHVLMVVSSYSFFIISGIAGHISILYSAKAKILTRIMLQMTYVGILLLSTGTVLGGVWAAESWGRFWDWDPKESWAFISISTYLITVHLYRFNHISTFGLAIGSILGLQVVTFTWYGVNYILGSGLHSYGFGKGGAIYYFIFVSLELCFVIWALQTHKRKCAEKMS